MTDKMRSEFEKWYKSQAVFHKSHLVPLPNGCYSGFIAETAWRAWQAARTVLEGFVMVPVELLDRFPELNEFNYSHDDVCELNAWGVELVLSAAPEGKK